MSKGIIPKSGHDKKTLNIYRLQNISGDASHLQAATTLLHFAGKSAMLDAFDEELFEQTVARIIVQSRSEFVFELKCGLKLKERM